MNSFQTAEATAGSARSIPTTDQLECWIDMLPDEIIAVILVVVVAPSSGDHIDLAHRSRFPAIVQHVCKRWKTISLTTPALWTTLYFRRSSNNEILSRLTRSGALPLDLYFESRLPDELRSRDPFQLVPPLILALQANVHRIQKLNVCGDSAAEVRETFKSLPSHFPDLLDLTVNVTSYDEPEGSQLPLTAPRLSSLHVINYSPDWNSLPITASLEELHIVDAYAAAVSLSVLVETLRRTPRLRVLDLVNQFISDWGDYESLQPVVMDRLESLSLKEFYRRELRRIFFLVQTPCVKTLVVQGLYQDDREIERAKMMELDFPALESLTLQKVYLSVEIAKQLPRVRHLALLYTPMTTTPDAIVLALESLFSYWRSRSDPIPLETLKVEGIPLSLLITSLQHYQSTALPSLHTIYLSAREALLGESGSELDFRTREEERCSLEALIKVEVASCPAEDSPLFRTWEERQAWKAENSTEVMAST